LIAYHNSLTPDSLSGSELDRYLALGWYRMHQAIFTTTHLIHDDCQRVHWLRFPIAEIVDREPHRRIRKRNTIFTVTIEDLVNIRMDHEELYERYRASIDFNGALSIHQSLFGDEDADINIFITKCISVYDGDLLIAGGYFDIGAHAGTSILHFFDPTYKRYSLGKYLVLLTLDFLKTEGFEFYYPGYVVAGNAKMDYKLFIGKKVAQYFDVETQAWRSFKESILAAEQYTDQEKLEVLLSFLR